MIKLKGVNYIPVLNGSVLNCTLRDDVNINGKRPSFFTNDSVFRYNKFLINPFHHSKLYEDIKKKNLILDEHVCFADSGGLQEITLNEKRYTPEEVFKWQQLNTDIGFSVDSMPFITPKGGVNRPGSFGGWKFDKANFHKYALKSKENIDVTKKYKDTSKDFKFYGIIQGRKYNEYLQWKKLLANEDYLDGYCLKAPNIRPTTLAETAIFAMENTNRPIHFLGIGNISRSIILFYASKYLKQPITFDSSSYDIGTQFRSYLLPFMINKKLRMINPKYIDNEDKVDEMCNTDDFVTGDDMADGGFDFCDCNACRLIRDCGPDMIKTNHPSLGGFLSVHNLILNIKIINYVKKFIHKREKIKEFIYYSYSKPMADNIINAFDMIDAAYENGHEYALEKFKTTMQTNKDIGNQKGLFDF